jgi:hypothetical protein
MQKRKELFYFQANDVPGYTNRIYHLCLNAFSFPERFWGVTTTIFTPEAGTAQKFSRLAGAWIVATKVGYGQRVCVRKNWESSSR